MDDEPTLIHSIDEFMEAFGTGPGQVLLPPVTAGTIDRLLGLPPETRWRRWARRTPVVRRFVRSDGPAMYAARIAEP